MTEPSAPPPHTISALTASVHQPSPLRTLNYTEMKMQAVRQAMRFRRDAQWRLTPADIEALVQCTEVSEDTIVRWHNHLLVMITRKKEPYFLRVKSDEALVPVDFVAIRRGLRLRIEQMQAAVPVWEACQRGDGVEVVALLQQRAIDPNEPVFNPDLPLLHALVKARQLELCQYLRTHGVVMRNDVLDTVGRTPLATFLYMEWQANKRLRRETVEQILQAIGGEVNDRQTLRTIAQIVIGDAKTLRPFEAMRAGGLNLSKLPLMHLCAQRSWYPALAHQLLDSFDQDPMERDEETGATLLECRRPELAELARDALEERPERDLAVAMALHRRLGSASLLGRLQVELVTAFILPHSLRRRNITETRTQRLQALIEAEGLQVSAKMRRQYLEEGMVFQPRLFRRAHFLATCQYIDVYLSGRWGGAIESNRRSAEARMVWRLEQRGVLFDEPFTPEYAARAEAALEWAPPHENDEYNTLDRWA